MALGDIKGQASALRMLGGAIARGRVASAYLFAGEEGVGKSFAAMNFAKTLNCLSPVRTEFGPDACDQCSQCRKIESGNHPDVTVLTSEADAASRGADSPAEDEPAAKGKSKEASRAIKVEAVRELMAAISQRPFEGRARVAIIDGAEKMQDAAANAFLKTLEEPGQDTVIVLISSEPERLLPTIRSRCCRVPFKPLSPEDCLSVIGPDTPDSSSLVRLSMGRPGAAVREDMARKRAEFFESLGDVIAGGRVTWKDRQEIEAWLDMASLLVRDLAVLKSTGSPADLVNADMAGELKVMAAPARPEALMRCYAKLRQLRARMFFNLNKGITWNYTGCVIREAGIHV